jgi:outer membrane protein OmpA-like peptidoglycan-associated protein
MARRGARARRLHPSGRARSQATVAGRARAAAGLLQLQRAAGNFAVQGLLDAGDPGIAHAPGSVPPEVDAVVGAGGRPLDPGVRAELEGLVGEDLGRVRIHDDAAAARSAEAAGARAYTAGEHVVFGPDRYAPQSGEGRALVAHEVGHVVAGRQQGGGAGAVRRDPKDRSSVKDRATLLSGVAPPSVLRLGTDTVVTIYFARDAFLMEPAAFAVVQKLAEQLSFMAKPMVSVDGYASTEGPERRNEELGRLRREAVVAILASKGRGVAFGGQGHGALEPAVPETASNPHELEAQRAQNRRVTIVVTDLSAAGAPPAPDAGEKAADLRVVPHEETREEEFNRRLKESLKLPIDLSPPKRSLGEMTSKWLDDTIDGALRKTGLPKGARDFIKERARGAVETGAEKALDSALDAAHLSAEEKQAIKAAVKRALEIK